MNVLGCKNLPIVVAVFFLKPNYFLPLATHLTIYHSLARSQTATREGPPIRGLYQTKKGPGAFGVEARTGDAAALHG